MIVTTWQQHEPDATGWGAGDFYERPLTDIYLFDFVTRRLELPRHRGSFSIKLVLDGEEEYFIGRRRIFVSPGLLLPVNGGESYASRIRVHTRSLSLFYPDRDVAAAQAALADNERRALDSARAAGGPASVPQIRCRISGRTKHKIARRRPTCSAEMNLLQCRSVVHESRTLIGVARCG